MKLHHNEFIIFFWLCLLLQSALILAVMEMATLQSGERQCVEAELARS